MSDHAEVAGLRDQKAVLVVDDDPFIRELILTTLEDVAELDLYEAADGREALEIAERVRPSLVFLDIDMPRLDGIAACSELRARSSTATIVMLTASAEDSARRRSEAAGADVFLTKPFSPLELLRLVSALGR